MSDPNCDIDAQIGTICSALIKLVGEERLEEERATEERVNAAQLSDMNEQIATTNVRRDEASSFR
jgi:hypothetical protein